MSNKEALLFKELVFKKADAEKDEINSKKRSSVTERREAFVPHHILSGVVSAAINRGNCLVILKTLSASNMPGDVIKIYFTSPPLPPPHPPPPPTLKMEARGECPNCANVLSVL